MFVSILSLLRILAVSQVLAGRHISYLGAFTAHQRRSLPLSPFLSFHLSEAKSFAQSLLWTANLFLSLATSDR
jgi:hypothetical protein